MPTDFYLVPLVEKKEIARNIFQFVFSTPSKNFSFLPGQYVSIQLEIDGRKDTRDFSIASPPIEKDKIMIVTKKGITEFKKKLLSLNEGDSMEISSPKGGFILENSNDVPQVFIAGGLGITPFYSMLKFAEEKESDKSLTLFASFSQEEDAIFYEELMGVQKKLANTKIIYTLSSPQHSWLGEKGRIDSELIKKYAPHLDTSIYYIVGKMEMVDSICAMLCELDIPQENIKIEYYTGY